MIETERQQRQRLPVAVSDLAVHLSANPAPDRSTAKIKQAGPGRFLAAAAFVNRRKRVMVLKRLANFTRAATVYRHGAMQDRLMAANGTWKNTTK